MIVTFTDLLMQKMKVRYQCSLVYWRSMLNVTKYLNLVGIFGNNWGCLFLNKRFYFSFIGVYLHPENPVRYKFTRETLNIKEYWYWIVWENFETCQEMSTPTKFALLVTFILLTMYWLCKIDYVKLDLSHLCIFNSEKLKSYNHLLEDIED